MKLKYFDVILSVIILACIGAFFMFSKDADSEYGPIELQGSSMIVSNQSSVSEIYLNVEVVEPGFVTIHETMGDAPTNIVASSGLITVGHYDQLLITPPALLLDGATYIAILHMDDGDGTLDIQKDKPISVGGQVVRQSFKVEVDVEAQQ